MLFKYLTPGELVKKTDKIDSVKKLQVDFYDTLLNSACLFQLEY